VEFSASVSSFGLRVARYGLRVARYGSFDWGFGIIEKDPILSTKSTIQPINLINHFPNPFSLINNYSLFNRQYSFVNRDGHRIANGRAFGNL
jgi:hypothetical protein